jgi:hypothetical protein
VLFYILLQGLQSITAIMFWTTIAASALLTQCISAQNMLRFACSQLTVERADPLVNPGMRPSPHTHQIIGGNSFNLTVSPFSLPLLIPQPPLHLTT